MSQIKAKLIFSDRKFDKAKIKSQTFKVVWAVLQKLVRIQEQLGLLIFHKGEKNEQNKSIIGKAPDKFSYVTFQKECGKKESSGFLAD
ncbi:MAG: hypothetical protein OXJ52_05625 [Oligoflexia bacterium]|nr:hypothetical protein [Oligoflexia bacterium]